jgi:hypothetical protein
MKLKCDKHNRRVVNIGGAFVHRTGDTSDCDSSSASMTDNRSNTVRTYAPKDSELLLIDTERR